MIEISITGSPISFDKDEIEVDCPFCELETYVTFGEIMRNDFAICRGCHCNIILEDYLGDVKKSLKKIEKLINNLWNNHG